MRIAILGGGISGLAAAHQLEKARIADPGISYTLYEASERLGGVIHSERVQDCLIEAGPDSFLTEKPAAAKLCAELGIANRILGSNDAQRVTWILVGKRLVPLPDGLMFMVPTRLIPTATTRLFSWRTKLRMGMELLHPPMPPGKDESVSSMVERHFGPEIVDRLVDPLLSGVYGGNASTLSARAVLGRLVEMESRYGSLCRGMLAARKRMCSPSGSSSGSAPKPPLFSTLKGGLQELIDALTARLDPACIRIATPVTAIDRWGSRWRVVTHGDACMYDGLIVALPAWVAARLLEPVDDVVAQGLHSIPYTSSLTVSLGYRQSDLKDLPRGFGFLVPASSGHKMLACTFVHRKFDGRTPADRGLLRCFLGGSRGESILGKDNAGIERLVRAELQAILGLHAEPLFVRIHRSRRSMAQYMVGHLETIARIRAAADQLPAFALAGNAFEGIGISDCIRTGQQAAARLLAVSETSPSIEPVLL